MTPAATSAPALGPSAIQKDWAARGYRVSRQYVDKLLRKKGMPGDTLEAAWEWVTARTAVSGAGKGGGEPSGGSQQGRDDLAPGDGSLESELARVKSIVTSAARAWQDACNAKPYSPFDAAAARKAYREAIQTRVEIESLIAEYRRDAGQQVDLVEAQARIAERLGPWRALMHSFDRVLAAALFPEAVAQNRPRIRAVIREHFLPAVGAAKKPLYLAHGRAA